MTDKTVEIYVDEQGRLEYVYDDAAAGAVAALGDATVRRASHVEPDAAGCWWADLSPVGGPKLGPFPPGGRAAALAAEAAWLSAQLQQAPLAFAGDSPPG